MSKVVLIIHRVIFNMKTLGIPLFPEIMNKIFIRLLFGCQLGIGTKIGNKVDLAYGGIGIVIHERAVIGNNVYIGSGVTIGGTTNKHEVPCIGDNTMISSGAKILGPIKIGKNCVIGANAVVLNDVPDNSVAVGVPAKIIKRNISIKEYRTIN